MSDNRETENKEFLQHLQAKLAASRQGLRLEDLMGREKPATDTEPKDEQQDYR